MPRTSSSSIPSSSNTRRNELLKNCYNSCKFPKIERFCCCSLKWGVLFTALLFLVNASLAFAGEAALYLGLLSAVSSSAVGEYLPPGTKIEPTYGLQGGLIALGLYALVGFLFGTIGVIRKSYRLITIFYIMTMLDVILGIFIGILSWFTGMSFNVLLSQIPTFILNIYLLIVIKSYRETLITDSSNTFSDLDQQHQQYTGNSKVTSGDIETGVNEDDLDLDNNNQYNNNNKGRNTTIISKSGGPVIEIGDDDDDDDGDITSTNKQGYTTKK